MRRLQHLVLVLLIMGIATPLCCGSTEADQNVKELLALQQKSSDGVIKLNAAKFEKYAAGSDRPYSLFIIADAKQFRNQGKLNLAQLFKDYSKVAKAYAQQHAGTPAQTKAFFASIEFQDNRDVFNRLAIPGLPYLARLAPNLNIKRTGSIDVPKHDMLSINEYPWTVPVMADFVRDATGLALDVSESQERSRFLPLITIFVVGCLSMVGYQLYQAPFMRWTWVYAVGALFVMWFSVSGGMYNIIRGVPLVGFDPHKKQAMLFMPGGQGQLGAEGFIMGTFYCSFGLLAFFFTKVLPTIKEEGARKKAAYGALVVGAILFRWILAGHLWKTGLVTDWYIF